MKSFEYNERTDQGNKFQIACALEQTFDIKYSGSEDIINAYEIESSLNHIIEGLGFLIIKIEK